MLLESLRDAAPDIVAIDGKTSRRSHGRAAGRGPLHLVSAWATRQRLVLGKEATEAKSNEIAAIPLLLERLELTGALVIIDAIGTQTAIAQTIRAKGADYLLALKGNRPAIFADVERFFADPPAEMIADTLETIDNDRGRLEIRRHTVYHDVGWLFSDRRHPDEPRFPGLAMIETSVERKGRTQHERRYYLCSTTLDAETFARVVRAHGGIENRLHWVLDVVFHDDLTRLRSGNGPQSMAIIRHIAMNLVRMPPRQAQHQSQAKTRQSRSRLPRAPHP